MKTDIRALELVHRIRDAQAEELAKKTPAEIIEFFRRAGSAAVEEARRRKPSPWTTKVG